MSTHVHLSDVPNGLLMPSQWADTRRRAIHGSISLLIACLDDARCVLLKYPTHSRQYRQEVDWLNGTTPTELPFTLICSYLNLDPDATRKVLLSQQPHTDRKRVRAMTVERRTRRRRSRAHVLEDAGAGCANAVVGADTGGTL